MSDKIRSRIAELQHRRRQATSEEALSEASDEVGELRHQPVEAGVSLRLQTALYARLKEMRGRSQLCKSEFSDAGSAIAATCAHLEQLGGDAEASGSGFFMGPVSRAFLRACLRTGYESFAATLPNLKSGVLLDVVLDDPLRGNFYEVEWW